MKEVKKEELREDLSLLIKDLSETLYQFLFVKEEKLNLLYNVIYNIETKEILDYKGKKLDDFGNNYLPLYHIILAKDSNVKPFVPEVINKSYFYKKGISDKEDFLGYIAESFSLARIDQSIFYQIAKQKEEEKQNQYLPYLSNRFLDDFLGNITVHYHLSNILDYIELTKRPEKLYSFIFLFTKFSILVNKKGGYYYKSMDIIYKILRPDMFIGISKEVLEKEGFSRVFYPICLANKFLSTSEKKELLERIKKNEYTLNFFSWGVFDKESFPKTKELEFSIFKYLLGLKIDKKDYLLFKKLPNNIKDKMNMVLKFSTK